MELSRNIYDYSVQMLDSQNEIDLEKFRGRKLLIVNVASKCGFTYQYEGLQKLYEEHDDLEILGFPCNQFLMQEPGSETKIAEFCSLNYGVTFPLTTKVHVKGSKKHPVYQWLTKKELNGVDNFKVSWNFNKFLIDEKGNLIKHFGSRVKPEEISL